MSLGKARPDSDVVLFVSHSGNTQECVLAARQLEARNVPILVLTGGKGEQVFSFLMQITVPYLGIWN